jgi:hypothetical protein
MELEIVVDEVVVGVDPSTLVDPQSLSERVAEALGELLAGPRGARAPDGPPPGPTDKWLAGQLAAAIQRAAEGQLWAE